MDSKPIEICAPAGNLPMLREAVDAGADAVYLGLAGDTNLRNFPGLNFSPEEVARGVRYAKERGARIYIAVNAYATDEMLPATLEAVDRAVAVGADAVIASDFAVLEYARAKYPNLRLHLSVQAGACHESALAFYVREFGIQRVILPRVVTFDEIERIAARMDASPPTERVELEVFGFGLLCISMEGRCFLSSYLTGESINTHGACAPPRFVRFTAEDGFRVTLNGITIDRVPSGAAAAYPNPCKGRYVVAGMGGAVHAIHDPCSLDLTAFIPRMRAAGVRAVKIEGRQRSRAYVRAVTRAFRAAIDGAETELERAADELRALMEGGTASTGCFLEKDH